ncbi:hypothetical protein V2J09_003273 [Rumex salicifolius]
MENADHPSDYDALAKHFSSISLRRSHEDSEKSLYAGESSSSPCATPIYLNSLDSIYEQPPTSQRRYISQEQFPFTFSNVHWRTGAANTTYNPNFASTSSSYNGIFLNSQIPEEIPLQGSHGNSIPGFGATFSIQDKTFHGINPYNTTPVYLNGLSYMNGLPVNLWMTVSALTRDPFLLYQLACSKTGAKQLEKLIKILGHCQILLLELIEALSKILLELACNSMGRKVIFVCFRDVGLCNRRILNIKMVQHCLELATDKSGCILLNSCMPYIEAPHNEVILSTICDRAPFLAQDCYGTYVVQEVVSMEHPHFTPRIVKELRCIFPVLSTQKEGSHLVEKCINSYLTKRIAVKAFVELRSAQLQQLACNEFGNFVIQKALSSTLEWEGFLQLHYRLQKALLPLVDDLRRSKFGRNVASKLMKVTVIEENWLRIEAVACPMVSRDRNNSAGKDFMIGSKILCRGRYQEAFRLFQYNQKVHHDTIFYMLPSLFKGCCHSNSYHGATQLHSLAIKSAAITHLVVSNSLLSVYSKFSHVQSARQLFDEMPHRDTITWNSLIMGTIQNGLLTEALRLFKKMCAFGYVPKPELIASILSICTRIDGCLRFGREIHGFVVSSGIVMMPQSVFLSTALVDLYMQGSESDLNYAHNVFGQMQFRNEVSWTAMIGGFAAKGVYEKALEYFRAMQTEGFKANRVTLISIMPVCARLGSIVLEKEIHGYAFRHGFDSETSFSAALMHAYCQFRGASKAVNRIFERTFIRDVMFWTSVIESCSHDGKLSEAIKHFNSMRMEGVEPNSVTVLAVLSACTNQASLSRGRVIHVFAQKSGLISDVSVGNSLLNMYAKCGSLADSSQVFKELITKDSVSWSSLISAYGVSGQGKEAVQIYLRMSDCGVEVDSVCLLSTLSACNRAGMVEEAQQLFNDAIEEGKHQLGLEHYSCLIDLLGRSGRLDEACEMARRMPMKPDIKIWSSLVSACIDHGRLEDAKELAHQVIELEPGNAANYTLLSMVYAKSGDWRKVEATRKLMRVGGFRKTRGSTRIELQNDNLVFPTTILFFSKSRHAVVQKGLNPIILLHRQKVLPTFTYQTSMAASSKYSKNSKPNGKLLDEQARNRVRTCHCSARIGYGEGEWRSCRRTLVPQKSEPHHKKRIETHQLVRNNGGEE